MVWHTMASGHTGSWLQEGRSGTLGLSLGLASPSRDPLCLPTGQTHHLYARGLRPVRSTQLAAAAGSRSHLRRGRLAATRPLMLPPVWRRCPWMVSWDILPGAMGTQAQQDGSRRARQAWAWRSHLAVSSLPAPVLKYLPCAPQGLWSPPCVALSSAPALSPKMPSSSRTSSSPPQGCCLPWASWPWKGPGRRTGGLRLALEASLLSCAPCALLTLPPRSPQPTPPPVAE